MPVDERRPGPTAGATGVEGLVDLQVGQAEVVTELADRPRSILRLPRLNLQIAYPPG
ncbi:hypothetical protein [Streptomyces sp. NPDC056817]|uniref:hypothetical protein n=1 Tax=Streptomyces sp. NPDC056817 TaxID=3345950 RepID=UPI0036C55FDF